MAMADIDQVAVIEQSAQHSPWSKEQFISSLSSSHNCYVVVGEGKILAYAVTSTALDEAELLNLTVAPSCQRQGVGRALLDWLSESFTEKITSFFLEVRASNVGAIALYSEQGFNEVGVRPNYYPPAQALPSSGHKTVSQSRREDAIIMAKPLL